MIKSLPKWVSILLLASLLINLLFVGALIGFKLKAKHFRPFPDHGGWMIRHLEPERRQALKPLLQNHAEKLRPLRADIRRARQAFEQAVTAEPFNEAAVSTAASNLQNVSNQMQGELHLKMIDVLKQLTPEERVQAMKFTHKGRHKAHSGKHSRRHRARPEQMPTEPAQDAASTPP